MHKHYQYLTALLLAASFLGFAGCQPKREGNVIKIAAKPMTEQLILSEMLAILIEEKTGLKTQIIKGVGGGSSNIHPAMLKGDFDLYPEYTGTAWSFILKKEGLPDDTALFTQLAAEYKEKYNLEWAGLYGFSNTYGLAVRKDLAEKYGLKSCSDLIPLADTLTFGAEYDFYEREDGYSALCAAYGFNFNKSSDLDIGLKYLAINNKQVDVMSVFTTDGQLNAANAVLLQDDKSFYRSYYCGTVARADTLERHPELREALMLMENILTEQTMAQLNYQVESAGRDEAGVARDYLRHRGLVR